MRVTNVHGEADGSIDCNLSSICLFESYVSRGELVISLYLLVQRIGKYGGHRSSVDQKVDMQFSYSSGDIHSLPCIIYSTEKWSGR